jgi:hypothetical protein
LEDRQTQTPYLEKRFGVLMVVALLVVSLGPHRADAQTLKAVKERGTLNCGVS